MDMIVQITTRIIQEQALVIGPIAWEEAQRVPGLTVDLVSREVSFTVTANQKEVVDQLVRRYEQLFGRASVEVCRDAVKGLIAGVPTEQVPTLLRP